MGDAGISAIRRLNNCYSAYFSLGMREMAEFLTSCLKSDVTIVFLDPDFLNDAKILAIRP